MAKGERKVKRRLNSIRYIWSIITWPEKPQYSWNLERNEIMNDTFLAKCNVYRRSTYKSKELFFALCNVAK